MRHDALTPELEREMLLGAGLDDKAPSGSSGLLNADMRAGTLEATAGDLARLIGRPTPLIDTL